jgi:hypothetical protein
MSSLFQVSSSAVTKTIKCYDDTLMRTAVGKEDPELPLLQRIRSLVLTAQINASQSSSNRHISTSTV